MSHVWLSEKHHGIKNVRIHIQPFPIPVKTVGYALICPAYSVVDNYVVTLPDLKFTAGVISLNKTDQLRVILWLALHQSVWCDYHKRPYLPVDEYGHGVLPWSMLKDNIKPLTKAQLQNPRSFLHTVLRNLKERIDECEGQTTANREETSGVGGQEVGGFSGMGKDQVDHNHIQHRSARG